LVALELLLVLLLPGFFLLPVPLLLGFVPFLADDIF
jgi:hypothetical protein